MEGTVGDSRAGAPIDSSQAYNKDSDGGPRFLAKDVTAKHTGTQHLGNNYDHSRIMISSNNYSLVTFNVNLGMGERPQGGAPFLRSLYNNVRQGYERVAQHFGKSHNS